MVLDLHFDAVFDQSHLFVGEFFFAFCQDATKYVGSRRTQHKYLFRRRLSHDIPAWKGNNGCDVNTLVSGFEELIM
jgi:hypothetical protein